MKLYTLDNQFVKETHLFPVNKNFTGIVECSDKTKWWYLDGNLHRLDGPACEWCDGTKTWFVNGKLHRLDGPAVEHSDFPPQYWINSKQVSKEQHKLYVDLLKLKGLT